MTPFPADLSPPIIRKPLLSACPQGNTVLSSHSASDILHWVDDSPRISIGGSTVTHTVTSTLSTLGRQAKGCSLTFSKIPPPSKTEPAPLWAGVAASQEAWGRPGACSWHLPTRSPRSTFFPHSTALVRWPLGYRERELTTPHSQRKTPPEKPITSLSTATGSKILHPG